MKPKIRRSPLSRSAPFLTVLGVIATAIFPVQAAVSSQSAPPTKVGSWSLTTYTTHCQAVVHAGPLSLALVMARGGGAVLLIQPVSYPDKSVIELVAAFVVDGKRLDKTEDPFGVLGRKAPPAPIKIPFQATPLGTDIVLATVPFGELVESLSKSRQVTFTDANGGFRAAFDTSGYEDVHHSLILCRDRFSASPQTGTSANTAISISNRITQLNARLQAGIAAGVINRTEGDNIQMQLREVRRLEGQYSLNGLTVAEREDLGERLRKLSEDLRLADGGPAGNKQPE